MNSTETIIQPVHVGVRGIREIGYGKGITLADKVTDV